MQREFPEEIKSCTWSVTITKIASLAIQPIGEIHAAESRRATQCEADGGQGGKAIP
jgi:hypothetical protein